MDGLEIAFRQRPADCVEEVLVVMCHIMAQQAQHTNEAFLESIHRIVVSPINADRT